LGEVDPDVGEICGGCGIVAHLESPNTTMRGMDLGKQERATMILIADCWTNLPYILEKMNML